MATIYIVEDDVNIREIERYALKNSGYQVEEFECGADLFKRLESKVPALILLDIMLPNEDGLDILTKIRVDKNTAKVPIIMVTAKTTTNAQEESQISYGNILVDNDKHAVYVDGNLCELTYKEFELFKYLVINKGIVLSRDKIMNQVWGFDYEGESRTVDMHIKTLRQKLGEAGSHIKTVRNVGYMVE